MWQTGGGRLAWGEDWGRDAAFIHSCFECINVGQYFHWTLNSLDCIMTLPAMLSVSMATRRWR